MGIGLESTARNRGGAVLRGALPLHRTLTALAAVIAVGGLAPAEARANPLELCAPSAVETVGVAPSSQALITATATAEEILQVGLADLAAGDEALRVLNAVVSDSANVDLAALSAYCSASGEAMRLAKEGSSARAQSFLVGALVLAEAAGDPELQANAAFRLALVSATLPVRPNARSASRLRSASVERIKPVQSDVPQSATDIPSQCSYIARLDLSFYSNWAVASESLECSIAVLSDLDQPLPVARAYLQLARISLAEADRVPEDRELLMSVASEAAIAGLAYAAQVRPEDQGFEFLARLAEAALDAGQSDDPNLLEALGQLGDISETSPDQDAWRMALLGRALLAADEHEGAANYFRRAILLESQAAQPLRMADWYLLLAQADAPNKSRHVMQAYQALEAVRPLLPRFDAVTQESIFQMRMLPVFTAAVDVQLDSSAASQDSATIAIAQRIVESFRQAEILSAFGSDCVPPREPITLDQLRDGEILLYPILLDDRVELIFASKRPGSAIEYRRVTSRDGASREQIEQLVKDTAYSLGYGEDDSWEIGSAELYRLLIEPIEAELTEDATLIIIPDGILRRLPFAALRDAEGTLLIEKASITVAPSLAYTQPGRGNVQKADVVAASLSKRVELARGNFSALKGTKREGDMAAGLVDAEEERGVHLENFTAGDLRTALSKQRVDILHLATHASFNGRSDRSFIVADGEAILISELRDLLGSNQLRGELISLIILSACETALGDDQASMGLAGSAVQAGAESALASLWEVDDRGTVKLMTNFYRFYAQGQGKAEAMRNAQLELISSGGAFSDPRIWAAFTLLGAWR